jgi:hypothetical protein
MPFRPWCDNGAILRTHAHPTVPLSTKPLMETSPAFLMHFLEDL